MFDSLLRYQEQRQQKTKPRCKLALIFQLYFEVQMTALETFFVFVLVGLEKRSDEEKTFDKVRTSQSCNRFKFRSTGIIFVLFPEIL